jgi:hypothetical protein
LFVSDWVFPVLRGEFEAAQVKELLRVVHTTQASIVLSSTWRESPAMQLAVATRLEAHGIAPPIACTTRVGNGSTRQRPAEIREWLDRHPAVTSW